MARRLNPRRVKIHRSYTVEEAARALGIHKNTVRNWLTQGLQGVDRQRPTLIHGGALSAFLQNRRRKAKQTCKPGEIYCVRCRAPKTPAGLMADVVPLTDSSGNLRAICPDCEGLIYRRVNLRQLETVGAGLEIAFTQALSNIGERRSPSLNCDLGKEAESDENA